MSPEDIRNVQTHTESELDSDSHTVCACVFVCLRESICALGSTDITMCGLWDCRSLVINMEMQPPYSSHTQWHPISLSLLLSASHERPAATE